MIAQDPICGVIAAPTASLARRQFRRAAGSRPRSRTLELRLDYLRNSAERTAFLRWLSGLRSLPVLIATCRTRRGGGRFSGSVEEELRILGAAVRAGCRWCDVESESAFRCAPEGLRGQLSPARLLISAHDFRRLPRDLPALLGRLDGYGGHAVKIAAVCRSLAEVRRLLSVARGRSNVVAVPMGEDALPARILALREGSALAYAAVGQSTAPGQMSLEDADSVYRLRRRFGTSSRGPTRRTRVFGVIGDPIGHSLSPLMHNAAFAARGTNAVLLPFRVRDLRDFLAAVVPLGIAGFAVTIPHKRAILRYLDRCDPLAERLGAVNTVAVRGGGRLYGYNTDYVGVLRAIERRLPLRSSRVLLLGAGGVARAAAFALAQAGAEVAIWARHPGQARALARAAGGHVVSRPALRTEFFDAIVNCTPVGMHPLRGSPVTSRELNCRLVMDLIYRPRRTDLLRLAERRGLETVSGVDMFVAQGVAQWEMWTGERAPHVEMRRVVDAVLACEERMLRSR